LIAIPLKVQQVFNGGIVPIYLVWSFDRSLATLVSSTVKDMNKLFVSCSFIQTLISEERNDRK